MESNKENDDNHNRQNNQRISSKTARDQHQEGTSAEEGGLVVPPKQQQKPRALPAKSPCNDPPNENDSPDLDAAKRRRSKLVRKASQLATATGNDHSESEQNSAHKDGKTKATIHTCPTILLKFSWPYIFDMILQTPEFEMLLLRVHENDEEGIDQMRKAVYEKEENSSLRLAIPNYKLYEATSMYLEQERS